MNIDYSDPTTRSDISVRKHAPFFVLSAVVWGVILGAWWWL